MCVLAAQKLGKREAEEEIMAEKEKSMVEKILDTERAGYAYFYPRGGGNRQEFFISTTPENMANFLGSHFYDAEKMIITDMVDRLILDTYGGFINTCPDQKLCSEIIPYLAPIQMGEKERNVRAAEEVEIIDILQACTNSRDQLLLLMIAETGFRIGEILGVDYTRDIDYQRKTVRVYFRDDNDNNARAKNAEYRKARVSDDTFDFLLRYMNEYRKLLQHQTLLFINIAGETAGKPMMVESVYDMLKRMEKKTGYKLTPHMLRRYFAVSRWNADWTLELISQALGHKHLDTTVKYLGILDDKLMEASREFYERHSDL